MADIPEMQQALTRLRADAHAAGMTDAELEAIQRQATMNALASDKETTIEAYTRMVTEEIRVRMMAEGGE